jgi:CBS domain containing-hemolysin-like protein
MNVFLQGLLRRLRAMLLERLRPGRDEQELLEMLGRAEAIQSEEQRSMLEQLVEFQDKRVREIMAPRSEIHAVEVNTPLAEVEARMIDNDVSRLPVMQGDIDHVLGVVYVRDVIRARIRGENPALTSMLRPCLRALELEQISGVLSEMKNSACHIAIVLDEFGGVAGLVTLSDLLREIVGEIGDNGEVEKGECQLLADGSYLVLARMHIEELGEALNTQLLPGDYDTVGGWITARLGRIPRTGESVALEGLKINIIEADPRRINKVRMQHLQAKNAGQP